MALSDSDRTALWAEFMRSVSDTRESLTGVRKADIRAAINGIDDYFDANASAMNQAIPQPARAALSAAQKALLFQMVAAKRYQSG